MENSIYERILNGELSFKVEDSCPVASKDIAVNLKNRKIECANPEPWL